MKRSLPWLGFVAGVALVAACGGRATLLDVLGDEYEGGAAGDGGGGHGGAPTVTISSSSSNGPGPTTNVVVASSTGSGPGVCDLSGDCGICADCAFQGPCQDEFSACFMDMQCSAFFDCMQSCGGGVMCFQFCSQQFPGGAQGYLAAIQCIVCVECEVDCQGQAPPQLCNQ